MELYKRSSKVCVFLKLLILWLRMKQMRGEVVSEFFSSFFMRGSGPMSSLFCGGKVKARLGLRPSLKACDGRPEVVTGPGCDRTYEMSCS